MAPIQSNIAVFDVGGSTLQYTLGSSEGDFHMAPTTERIGSDPAGQVVRAVRTLRDELGYDISVVSIATAGPIIRERLALKRLGTVAHGEISDVQFGQRLGEAGVSEEDIYLENDTNVAALAEYIFGSGKMEDCDNLVYFTFSTGIGAGIVQDGAIHRGQSDNAGKVGSFSIATEFEEITKKTAGCWEEVCGGKGIPDLVEYLLGEESRKTVLKRSEHVSAQQLYEAATAGDAVARDYAINVIGPLNARGVAITALCFDPEIITIGGSIALNNPELVRFPIIEHFEDYYPKAYPKPNVSITQLGETAELLGALRLPSFRE